MNAPSPSTTLDRLRAAAPTLSVGLLAADLTAIGHQVKTLEQSGTSVLHFDVMDGNFCPALTFGPPLIKAVKTSMLKDVHLFITDPLAKLDAYVAAGADIITVQAEACAHVHRVLQALGKMTNANDPARGIVRGLALDPGTPLAAVEDLLDELEMVLLVAVNPGFSGQKFIGSAAPKMERLLEMIRSSGRDILVCLDGGITGKNLGDAVRLGADLIVTGSAVFEKPGPEKNVPEFLEIIRLSRT